MCAGLHTRVRGGCGGGDFHQLGVVHVCAAACSCWCMFMLVHVRAGACLCWCMFVLVHVCADACLCWCKFVLVYVCAAACLCWCMFMLVHVRAGACSCWCLAADMHYCAHVDLAQNTSYFIYHDTEPFSLTVHGVASSKGFSYTAGMALRPINLVR